MCSAHLTLRARAGALVPLLLTALGPDDETLNEVDPTAPRERAIPPEQAAPRDAATTVLVALVSPPVVTAGADGAGRSGSVSAPAGGGAGGVSFAGPSMATAALHAAMDDSAPPCVEVVVVAGLCDDGRARMVACDITFLSRLLPGLYRICTDGARVCLCPYS
jgi:hypothetical protein